MESADVAAATGWAVHHLETTDSTNDVAAALLRQGASARTVVVADRQTAGRGRQGRGFASPAGGLYASLLVEAEVADLPAVVVALAGLAAAESIEEAAAVEGVQLKWPNDLWVDGRKVGGILLETADTEGPVVVGIGINLGAVPEDLPEDVRAATGAVEADRQALLVSLLRAVDAWQGRRGDPGWPDALEAAWRGRLALLGASVSFSFAGRTLQGVLEDASLRGGLLVRDAISGPVWRQAEHVQDLRPAARTIP